MKNIILFLALIFVSTPALARGHRAYHCFYLTSNKTGDVESECYASKPKCEKLAHSWGKVLRTPVPLNACFVSRETQSFQIPTWQTKPLTKVLPNRASCLESYQIHLASGDAPTTCHPTESK